MMCYLCISVFSVNALADNFDSALNPEQRQQKQYELKKLRSKIQSMREKIQLKQQQKDVVSKSLQKIEVRIGERAYILKKISHNLKKQISELKKLKKNKNSNQQKLNKQRKILARQIRAAYMIGQQEYLKLLLNQQSPALIGRTLTYYDYFHKARSHNINEAITTVKRLQQLSKKIKLKTDNLKRSQKQQRIEKQKLEDDFKNRASVVQELAKEIADSGNRLNKMRQDEQTLHQLLNQIQDIMPTLLTDIDKREPFALRRGRLNWPLKGKVKRLFGKSRQVAGLKWNGVIIPGSEGRDVRSISHGRVAYADWLRGYGLLVIIDHGDGFMSLYGHNQALYKETGDWVEEGEVISTVGRSGGQLNSGLYFEVRVKGKPSNPVKWCKG